MKITFDTTRKANPYTSRNGNTTYVYAVSGTPEELAKFKASKKEFYREDETTKSPLYFTTQFVGKSAEVVETSKGEFVPDTTKEKMFGDLEKQFGSTIAREKMAEMAA